MARLTATWSLPVEREGGEPFDASTELQASEIRLSADGGSNWSDPAVLAPTETSFIVDNIAAGTYTVELVFVDTDGRRSGEANAEGKVLGPPLAAADLTVTIE